MDKTIKGSEIISLWQEAKDMVYALPNYENHVGREVYKNGYNVTNDLYQSCWFERDGVVFHTKKYREIGSSWGLCQYVGLYGKATEIRYIDPDKEYEV